MPSIQAVVIVLPRCHRHRSLRPLTPVSDASLDQSPPCARSVGRRQHVAVAQFCQRRLPEAAKSARLSPSISPTPAPMAPSSATRSTTILVIASDKDRSGEARLPASTFKIPNSLIALETGVVEDPDKDVFKWDGVKRSIEAWNMDHTMRTAIAVSAVPVYQEIARRIGAGTDAEICRSVRIRQPQYRRRHRPVLADRRAAHRSGAAGRFRRPAAPRRAADLQAEPGSGARYPAGDQSQATASSAPSPGCSAPRSASPRSAGWWAGPRRAAARPCLRSTWIAASRAISPTA